MDLIDKMGQNPPHAFTISLADTRPTGLFGASRIRYRLPCEVVGADLEFSEPEPDLAVLREASSEYALRHPSGNELLLTVEVADSTAAFDCEGNPSAFAAVRELLQPTSLSR